MSVSLPGAPTRRGGFFRSVTAFARNDLRGVYREPLLAGIVFAPVVWTLMVRFGTPAATDLLARRFGFDLHPYYPLVLTSFLLLTSPLIAGALAAFLMLDERDADTLTAIRVTPASTGSFVAYRMAVATLVGALYVTGTFSFSGLVPTHLIPATLVAAASAGICGIPIGLAVVVLARNKVEGIAVVRALGIVVAGLPILPYFLDWPWNLLFGVLPPYWASEIYWTAAEGGLWWPYAVGGIVVNIVCTWLLAKKFLRSL